MRNLLAALLILMFTNCSKNAPPKQEHVNAPKLILPVRDELCTNGQIVSTTASTIAFKWTEVSNVEFYDLIYTNLLTGASGTFKSSKPSAELMLLRNTPYSWHIDAKHKTGTVKSEVWKFYIAGIGTTSYAPYPAEVVFPALGQVLDAVSGKIELVWKGSDVDQNIKSYDVYFGTSSTPPIYQADVTASQLKEVEVKSKVIYYWKVKTKDTSGNISDSPIFQFSVN